MKLRAIALLALLGVLIPVWAGDVITHETRVDRQRITTVLNAPGGVPVIPQCRECRVNRQRITTIFDMPGMVRDAVPADPQLDTRRIESAPRPRPINGLPAPTPAGNAAPKAKSSAGGPDKEEVRFQAPGKAVEQPVKPVDLDRAKSVAEKVTVAEWWAGKRFKDDKGRIWCLIMGQPEAVKPDLLDGWVMQAADSPILFFTKTGRMWKLLTQPLP